MSSWKPHYVPKDDGRSAMTPSSNGNGNGHPAGAPMGFRPPHGGGVAPSGYNAPVGLPTPKAGAPAQAAAPAAGNRFAHHQQRAAAVTEAKHQDYQRVSILLTGTPNGWQNADGRYERVWTMPRDVAAATFGKVDHLMDYDPETETLRAPDLRKGVIISATILSLKSDAPYPVSLKLTSLPALNTLTNERGEKSLVSIPAGRDTSQAQEIYKPPPNINDRLMRDYAFLRPDDLREGMYTVGPDYHVVENHPVIGVIRRNEEKYPGLLIRDRYFNGHFVIPKDIVNVIIESLAKDVLGTLPHSNLSYMEVVADRADGIPITDPWWKGTKYQGTDGPRDALTVEAVGDQIFTVEVQIGILYSISRRENLNAEQPQEGQ